MKKMLSYMRACIDGYDMLQSGDRVAVGVSGGKDSLSLLLALAEMRRFYPRPFELSAITLDMGFDGADFSGVSELCARLDVPYHIKRTNIKEVVFDIKKESNPCSLCAKMRRGALNTAALALGINKIALGHHFDDAVETFMLNLLYEGRVGCFQPVTYLDRSGITQIRPMLYVNERSIRHFARRHALPVVHNPCPADKKTRRQDAKELLRELDTRYPGLKNNIFGGLQRSCLPGWAKKSDHCQPAQQQKQHQPDRAENADDQPVDEV